MLKKYAIIVAAGSGRRLESEVPKQFMELAGKPMLLHSLEKFFNYDKELQIYLVLPQSYISFWKELAEKNKVVIPHEIVAGGAERFHSVKTALDLIETDETGLVAVHDAARPLLSEALIKLTFDVAADYGSALPAIPVKDSLRKLENEQWEAVNRKDYKAVQTPQVFNLKSLKEAYNRPYHDSFTDDASVYESAGNTIQLVDGEEKNFKVTTPEDFVYCRYLIENYR